jgi:hypothetical protein
MWGTREPPEWLARRWNRKHNNKGESESVDKEGEGESKVEGQGDAERSEAEGERDVEIGGQGGGSCCYGGRTGSIRLPPMPKVQLPEVSMSPATTVASRQCPSVLEPGRIMLRTARAWLMCQADTRPSFGLPVCVVGCQLELEHVRHRLKGVLLDQQEKAQVRRSKGLSLAV